MAIETLYPAISPSLDLNFAGSKTLDPRITFSRASAATYYDGKTLQKADENLLLNSQEFNSWSKTYATVASNAVLAPDSTATADTLIASAGTGSHNIHQIYGSIDSPKTFTFSVNAKKGTSDYLNLSIGTSSSNVLFAAAAFNLDTVAVSATRAVGSGFSVTSANIVPAIPMADGWYRCILTGVHSAAVNLSCSIGVGATGLVDSNQGGMQSFAASGSETLHVWGAQLEQRSQVTTYTPTTTQPITNYIPVLQTAPAGVPRFDHNPVTGESLGLLIEEQRTNVQAWSQQFDNAAWSKNNLTVAANTIIAPDGTLTGNKLIENAVNSTHTVSGTISAAGTCTLSVYLKAAERTRTNLNIYDVGAGTSYGASFDIYSGVVVTNSAGNTATITPVGNGWFRCSISRAILGSGGPFTIFVSNAAGGSSYQGDGYSGIYIWGAQLESGAFPTSYIKTEASQGTRAADRSLTAALGQLGAGTIYVDATVRSGNTLATSGATTFAATASTRQKTAVAYDATSTRKSINGAAVTSSAGTQGGSNISIAPGATGWINKLSIYPQNFGDAHLQSITA